MRDAGQRGAQRAGTKVDISVLVPVLNEARQIRAAIEAMLAQRFAGQVEFLFIDGGSSDGTQSLIAELASRDLRIRLLENPKRFTPQALNIGLSAATGEFIARMDAHTIYPPEYLQAGVDRLRLGDVDWVSGPQITAGDGPWSRLVALAMATPLGVGSAKFRSRLPAELEIDSNGFCGVWRRSTLERHQGWDEEWPINQDSELAARMRAAGERIVVVPEMAAAYLARDSPRTLIRQYWRYGQYRAKTCLRHPESMRRSHALPPLLAATLAGTAGPSRVARPARLAMLVYASTITVVSARAQTPRRRDRALLPVVLMSMHLAWGAGFIVGLARFARAGQSTKP